MIGTRRSPLTYRRNSVRTIVAGALVGALAVAACSSDRLKSGPGASASASVAEPRIAELSVPAPEPTLRLISQSEYANTISRVFGPDIVVKVRFAPVNRVDGLLAVGRSTTVLTSGGLDPLDAAARSVAAQVVDPAHRPFLVPCAPANPDARDDQCARVFFAKVGRLIFRHRLTNEELARVVDRAGSAVGPAGGFYSGLAYALSSMLISPQFLYIRERAEPDPTQRGAWRLDGYSKAARLSFLLWDSAPDDELLTAAERGDLHSTAGLQREVNRMIASPLYRDGVRTFFADFLVLEAFDTLAKDPVIYPAFTLKAVEEAREQVLRTAVDEVVDRRGDYRELFTTRRTFLSSDLAVLYRMQVDTGSQGWVPYEFQADDPRAGILTQVGFLAQYAHPGRSSSTRRGRGIREVLLCQKVPDPPPNVDFSLIEDPNAHFHTARERLAAHQQNPVCAGCHALTDPIGLGLENFDGAGQYRASEHGAVIDASGKLDGAAFSNAAGLGQALRDNPALKSCIVNRLYAYSVGRKVTSDEKPRLKYYQEVLDKRGYRFDEMFRLMILDKSFFAVSPPKVTVASSNASTEGFQHAH
jgi:hypothetical protein